MPYPMAGKLPAIINKTMHKRESQHITNDGFIKREGRKKNGLGVILKDISEIE